MKFRIHLHLQAWILGLLLAGQAFAQQKTVTLQDVWQYYKFYPASAGGFAWMADDQFYSTWDADKNLMRVHVLDEKKQDTLAPKYTLTTSNGKQLAGSSYSFGPREQRILFTTETESVYRRSSKSICYVYDRGTRKITTLAEGAHIFYPTFSPDGNKVAYVKANNLWYQDLNTGETVQITADGKANHIINGATDWVYEEEFAIAQAFKWSESGKWLAFLRFDESRVKEFTMDLYGSLYPERYTFKYPKAGEANAVVSVHIYELGSKQTHTLATTGETHEYFPRIWWTPQEDRLVIAALNRHQNKLELLLTTPQQREPKPVYTETNETYITEVSDGTIRFLKDGKRYLLLSDKDGWQHLYLRELNSDKELQLTKGQWEVSEFYGLDEANGVLYYAGNEAGYTQRQVYSIGLDGKKKKQLTEGNGHHSADFSSAFSYYVHNHSNSSTPPVITLRNARGKDIRTLQDNAKLRERLREYTLSPREFFTLTTEEGISLDGWMMKPLNFNPKNKYPVLMYTYGGPGSQSVQDSYDGLNHFWYQSLCADGYLVVCVDNRGCGGKGAGFSKATYQDLGALEVKDQISAANWLAKQSYVDAKRIGIWGWSFGGYLSSLCITKGADVFKTAVAVAPVSNWRFYDTIYTERYLRTPQENAKGYDENSPVNFADKLKGNYLIVHGMADDNVHLQNATEMIDALVAANKDFEMLFYPNRNHGIYGGYTRLHLYRYMTDFLNRKLKN
ncbi:MAG: S9 family peptidase [Bacteroidetes bacterium]|nr:S9 family peptidase [Bacteroidota bacterium]